MPAQDELPVVLEVLEDEVDAVEPSGAPPPAASSITARPPQAAKSTTSHRTRTPTRQA